MIVPKKILLENKFICYITFLSFIFGGNFLNLPSIVQSANYLVQVIMITYMFFAYITAVGISRYFIITVLFVISKVLSNLLNSMSIYFAITSSVSLVGITLFVELLSRQNPRLLLQTIFHVMFFLVLINTASIFLLPNGFYQESGYWALPVYLFGIRNQQGITLMLALGIFLVFHKFFESFRERMMSIIGVFMVFLTSFYLSSTTLLLVSLFVLIYIVLILNTKLSKYISANTMLITYIIVWFSVVILRVSEHLSFLFVDLLGKTTDLSFRTVLWDNALKLISEKPFWGYGISDGLYITRNMGLGSVSQSAHNLFLQLLLSGGLVSLLLFIFLIFMSTKKLSQNKKDYVSACITISLIAILFLSISEVFNDFLPLYLLMILGYNYPFLKEFIQTKTEGRSNQSYKKVTLKF